LLTEQAQAKAQDRYCGKDVKYFSHIPLPFN
jgi:hypothetical protein